MKQPFIASDTLGVESRSTGVSRRGTLEDPSGNNDAILSLDNRMLSGGSISITPLSQFLQQPSLTQFKAHPSIGGSGTNPGTASSRILEDDQLIEVQYFAPSILRSIIMTALGVAFGVALHVAPVAPAVVQWIGLFGDLYNRALGFPQREAPVLETSPIWVNIQCPNENFLISSTVQDNSTNPGSQGELLACVAKNKNSKFSSFKVVGLTGLTLPIKEGYDIKHPVTFSKQTADFFDVLFPNNVIKVLTIQETLGIFTFAMLIGIAIVKTHELNRRGGGVNEDGEPRDPSEESDSIVGENYAYMLIKQTNCVLEVILNWLLPWMPLGLCSSLTSWIALNSFNRTQFDATANIFAAFGAATVAFFFFVACSSFYLLLRKNPFSFLSYLIPPLLYLATTGDAIAALPIFMRALDASKQVSRTLSQTVLSVGVTVSLSGTGSFFVLVNIFMAYTSGLEDQLTGGRIVALVVLSAITSLMGVQATPGACFTRLITIWTTIFDTPTVPGSFAYVAWMEVYFSRLRRMQNFIVVAFTARILADQLDESVEDEEARRGSDAERLSRF